MNEESSKNNLIKSFVNNTTLNIILRNLPKEERIEFYNLLLAQDYVSATKIVNESIPNLNELLTLSIAKEVK